jgi:YfiR/HmsC-like
MSVLRALLLLLLLCLAGLAPARAAGPSEYQVKAVFLFNFSQFVAWPAQAFGAADTPFSICIVGADPFGPELDATVRGENVQGHPFVIRRYPNPGALESACHIVFIGDSSVTQLENILKGLDDRAILTVSDIERSAERGTMIQFASEHNRLRLRINIAAAKAAGLTISSKLLRPSEIVGAERG